LLFLLFSSLDVDVIVDPTAAMTAQASDRAPAMAFTTVERALRAVVVVVTGGFDEDEDDDCDLPAAASLFVPAVVSGLGDDDGNDFLRVVADDGTTVIPPVPPAAVPGLIGGCRGCSELDERLEFIVVVPAPLW
jgi:hypothetical protein